MPDYQNGKVYKMVAGGMTYVGSTTRTLAQRKAKHRANWKYWKAGKGNKTTSFDLFETGEPVDIVLLEDAPCERKEQLHARERHWIEKLDCVNKMIPGRTEKEYRDLNKEKMREYMKKYYEAKKDAILERNKRYRDANQDTMREYQKEYRENNQDKIKEYQKEYYEANKKKLNEQMKQCGKQRAPCPKCGKEMRKGSILRHVKTQHC